ncbi:MAG: T9SS type A sorting domain-containing protein, partial [Flavobacteriales bacterium]|nr:T9SS type A sorting domain-containing protein [Flavobacteriales bacterium]
TNGITRTATTQTNWDADDQGGWGSDGEANAMKKTSSGGIDSWDYQRYLNIWVCDLTNSQSGGMTLGYAYLPGLPSSSWNDQTWKDGLVVDFQWFGTIQGASGDSRTATHEIGHYLGLNHTFCESQSGGCCDNDDSNVDDTPLCYDSNNDGPYFGPVTSSTNNNTCNDIGQGFSSDLLDMDENFMAYSQNTWMFSHDQVNAMNATLNGYRLNLKNSNVTLNCTGTVNTNNMSEKNKIKVYPNPTKGEVFIQNLIQTSNNSIVVRDILGKIIFTSESGNNLDSLDISYLEDGIYFIEIAHSNGVRIEKVILSK